MSTIRVAFFGDVVGEPGRRAFAHGATAARREHHADLVIVNGENARHGAGLHEKGYRELRAAGADAVTLGDHALDEPKLYPLVRDPSEPVCRPVNLTELAKRHPETKTFVRLKTKAGVPTPIFVTTITGRVHMKHASNDPFDAMDAQVKRIADEYADALIIVEVHCEATSEKTALAWHAAERHRGRVVAVVGTHTHVPTADARIDRGVAMLTDLGMCGGHGGVIGFDPALSATRLKRQSGGKLEPTALGVAATGVVLEIALHQREAMAIEPVCVVP